MVTADVFGLYPNIPYNLGLQFGFGKRLSKTGICRVPSQKIISLPRFVFKSNYFEFNEKVCKQMSGTAIGTKFAPPYTHIFMDEMETSFLKIQQLQPFTSLRYIDDIFFIWVCGEEQLNLFLKDLNKFHPNLKFMYKTS